MRERRAAGAHQAFVEATRAAMAGAERRSDGVTCPECIEVGATAEESLVIHAGAPAGRAGGWDYGEISRAAGWCGDPLCGCGPQ